FPSPIRIVEVAFPAGARVSYESGARETAIAQQIWVRAGTIEVTVGKVTHELNEDDCLAMQLDGPVTFRNRTRKTAHYIVVLSSCVHSAFDVSKCSPRANSAASARCSSTASRAAPR